MKILNLFLILLCLTSCRSKSKIIEVTSFAEVKNFINTIDLKNTWVFFDVHGVLMDPSDQILKSQNKKVFYHLLDSYSKGNEKIKSTLHSIVLRDQKVSLIDITSLELIDILKKRKIQTFGLTAGVTGKYEVIESGEDLRRDNLKSIGIEFSNNFISQEYIFKNLICKRNGWHPSFKHGIIFTCKFPKGEILEEFLRVTNSHLNSIIFIDNKLENLKSVEELCIRSNIKFYGILYKHSGAQTKLDLSQVLMQFETLMQKKQWINLNK
jgi:hypothetical protein